VIRTSAIGYESLRPQHGLPIIMTVMPDVSIGLA
jgi:hypothetical protein